MTKIDDYELIGLCWFLGDDKKKNGVRMTTMQGLVRDGCRRPDYPTSYCSALTLSVDQLESVAIVEILLCRYRYAVVT